MCLSHLSTPIGLGLPSLRDDMREPERIMMGVITYLRHGMVCYYYLLTVPPKDGPSGGGFGPINHMFPITPLELGEGFIVGKERILSAISLDRLWQKQDEPIVSVFDIKGRKIDASGRFEVKQEGEQWRITLQLKDWAEVAVVE
jgi:hypothetical protein